MSKYITNFNDSQKYKATIFVYNEPYNDTVLIRYSLQNVSNCVLNNIYSLKSYYGNYTEPAPAPGWTACIIGVKTGSSLANIANPAY